MSKRDPNRWGTPRVETWLDAARSMSYSPTVRARRIGVYVTRAKTWDGLFRRSPLSAF
jgi:hypothetical protein